MNKPLGRTCCVDNCPREVDKTGGYDMCGMHYQRFRRHGDPHKVAKRGGAARGDRSARWTGNQASYAAVHLRLAKNRGSASALDCVDCTAPAAHWSYDNDAPFESCDPVNGRYSPLLDHYSPRCVPCHKKHDNAARLKESA